MRFPYIFVLIRHIQRLLEADDVIEAQYNCAHITGMDKHDGVFLVRTRPRTYHSASLFSLFFLIFLPRLPFLAHHVT